MGIQKLLKLIEISCLQVIKGKWTMIPKCFTYFTHICQLCVPTIVEVSLKRFFFTQGNLQGGRVEDHRMMFTTAIIYSSSTLHIYIWLHDVFNPLHPNIRMHILHTVLYTFPDVLARRICLTIKRLFSWLSFPLFSWP